MQMTTKILVDKILSFRTLQFILLLFCYLETFACLKQVNEGFGICHVTGTASSSVELSLCLAMCLPVLLWNSLEVLHWRDKSVVERIFVLSCCVCTLCTVVLIALLSSRASWLASIIGCGYVCSQNVLSCCGNIRAKKWLMAVAFSVVCLIVVGLYFIRTNSADGRLLIWKVTANEMLDGDVTLLPRDVTFSVFYGNAQERYFSECQRPLREQMLAGIPDNAYNEWLQMTVEWGCLIAGAALIALILVVNFLRKSKQPDSVPLSGCMWTFVVLSLLSYPLRCSTSLCVALFVLAFAVAICVRHKILRLCLVILAIVALPVKAVIDSRHIGLRQKALEQCSQLDIRCAYEDSGKYIDCYKRLKQYIGEEPEYLLAYAKALYDTRKYNQSRQLLRKAQKISGDPVFYLIEGKCRQAQKCYSEAEGLYKKAYYRIPHKIYPLYLLMNLYKQQHKYDLAGRIAKVILQKKPKVESEEFDFIQGEAWIYLNQSK
jgi:tetratricopeptide (TPR) repeat protein